MVVRLAGGDGVGPRGRVAQLFEDPPGARRPAVDQQGRRPPQGRAAEVIRHRVPLNAVEEGRDLNELGPHGHEAVINHGAPGTGQGTGGRTTGRSHGRKGDRHRKRRTLARGKPRA
jgi:hypothetical protein